MAPRYKVRVLAQPRRLAPNIMLTIVQILEDARQPLREDELVGTLRQHYHRLDPDFQRQVRLNLRDGISYGILRRTKDLIELRTHRLGELMATLSP
ncbi:uncharacterized protein LOC110181926 [Drosophila serrata]|uniref:uncharacterized protein LOC110181926 n=1 Tax=Drosophila serrata TaxID=7274 RepID=UPI000A1D19BB|nr:uncharacterized protein LOC110181926 [Drosophila serrata]KAH8376298.1 hypothetical protein KR200_000366 [Drosophila serrata]